MVKLIFTKQHSPLNTNITGPDGQILYKIVSPFKFGVRTTTISVLADADDLATLSGKHDDDGKLDDDDEDGKLSADDHNHDGKLAYGDDGKLDYVNDGKLEGGGHLDDDQHHDANDAHRFSHLAKIEWHNVTHNKIWFDGVEHDARKYLQPAGLLNQHRVFKGPDSKEYKWNMGNSGMHSPVLEIHDETKARVAKFRERRLALFGTPRDGSLEIFDGGRHMVDAIVTTFTYVNHLRWKRIAAARASSAAGAIGGSV